LRGLKVVDLSHTIEPGMPVFPTHPQHFHMEWHTGDPATLHQLLISEHAGTHLDAPLHFYNSPGDARRLLAGHLASQDQGWERLTDSSHRPLWLACQMAVAYGQMQMS
jgi:hypothetical protein